MTANTDDDRLLIEAAQADPARFVEQNERYVDRVYAFVSISSAPTPPRDRQCGVSNASR